MLKQWHLSAGHGQAKVLVRQPSRHAPARRAVEKADLDEERLVYLFERVLLFGEGCC